MEALAPIEDLPRRERRKREIRGRILQAALELFDEEGFHATKVAEICDRADVAQKTFFNHFPTKRHVLAEVAQESLGRLLGLIDEALAVEGATRDRLEHLFRRIGERSRETGPMRRELLTEMVHLAHEEGTEERARVLHDAFGAIVEAGLGAGDVRTDHPPETLTQMILGAFYALMFNWANVEGYDVPAQARATARFLGDAMEGR